MQTRESVLNTNKEFKNLEIETFLKINTKDNAIMKTKRLSEVQAQIQGGGGHGGHDAPQTVLLSAKIRPRLQRRNY